MFADETSGEPHHAHSVVCLFIPDHLSYNKLGAVIEGVVEASYLYFLFLPMPLIQTALPFDTS